MIADGIVHAVGVSLGLVGGITIFVVAAHSLHTAEVASIAVYSVGLLSMLVSQPPTIYGQLRAKWILRRFDHSAIFVMIADAYTPFIAQMRGGALAIGLLVGVWLTAIAGIILKLFLPSRFDRSAVILYLLLVGVARLFTSRSWRLSRA